MTTHATDQYIASVGGKGILRKEDVPSLNAAERRVLALMRDGQWHTADEIIERAGQREGLRRMRKLRSRGWIIERNRNLIGRDFSYRLLNPKGRL